MDKKGMTLIEMIATIFILSIASLTLFGGFSAVINIMGNSGRIKNNSDMLLSYAEETGDEDIKAKIESDDLRLSYTISSPDRTVIVNRKGAVLNIKGDESTHLKYMKKTENSQKVKDTDIYNDFQNNLQEFKLKLQDAKKAADDYLGNNAPYNQFLKGLYMDDLTTWVKFPTELLPSSYADHLAGQSLYVLPYFPWEIAQGQFYEHGGLLIFLNQNNIDVNSLKGTTYLHIIYDYEKDTWYYCNKDSYRLLYGEYTVDGKAIFDIENNGFIKSWADLRNIMRNPKNGWKVLDVEAEYNDERDSFWKDVT